MEKDVVDIKGFMIHKGYLSPDRQGTILTALREVAKAAPMFVPETPSGKTMSVQMTSTGHCGWLSDRRGYRYSPKHPSGLAWPPIPQSVLEVWEDLVSRRRQPDTCLINYYRAGARMGMHQDKDEKDFSWPVLSISLGDEGLFRMGNRSRGGPTRSIWLASGDVVVMGGEARLSHHGIDRIRLGSSPLLKNGGRINLTLRVVN